MSAPIDRCQWCFDLLKPLPPILYKRQSVEVLISAGNTHRGTKDAYETKLRNTHGWFRRMTRKTPKISVTFPADGNKTVTLLAKFGLLFPCLVHVINLIDQQ
jgi:hypothetical protein